MGVTLNNNLGFKWFNNNKCYVKGYLYDKSNKLYKNEKLINYFYGVSNENEFRNKLEEANGIFAVIIILDKYTFAAVDRIRSLPLFCSMYNSNLIISDDAYIVKDKIGASEMDDISIHEFLLTGYVTNEDTLYKDIKQIQAGEYVVFDNNTKELKRNNYYRFEHKDFYDMSNEDLIEKLDNVHVEIFRRLIESLDGRTAVVPLSGGYDSRLVAVMIKRLGYENVICYSYGKEGNEESKVSKKVADYLGYKWIFIPYKNDLWYQWFNSKERVEYFKYGSNLTSLAHIQDWPAVMELKNKELIPKDSIFIPGHAADFLEGSHIPELYINKNNISNRELLDSIYRKHYFLPYWKDKYNKKFEKKISSSIEITDNMLNEPAASLFEEWDWKERQAKFICNSVRVYEFFGYEWRIPLWDNELMDYWSKVHLQKRYMRKLYKEYDNLHFKELNKLLDLNDNKSFVEEFKSNIKNILKLFLTKKNRAFIKNKFNKLNSKKAYTQCEMQWYGIMKYNDFRKSYNGSNNINLFLVNILVKEINKNF